MRKFLKITCVAVLVQMWVGIVAMADADQITAGLKSLGVDPLSIISISETPMKDVYEVNIGQSIYHVSATGTHVFIGEVYDINRRVSLKDEKLHRKISEVAANFSVDSMIVMAPEETKRHITVFTDIDCGYCRQFHRQVPDLLKAGLEVRYLAYPRAGIGSSSYDKLVSAWCAEDQAMAITKAKLGEQIESLTCENPVKSHFTMGMAAGIQGTPTMVLDDGSVIPGFVETNELLTRFELN